MNQDIESIKWKANQKIIFPNKIKWYFFISITLITPKKEIKHFQF